MPAAAKSVPQAARPYGGLAMEERVATRRARFIEAGVELFGTQGFRGATVRGVCAAAGLTDRYFYESFPTLEALLAAVYTTLKDRFAARLTDESLHPEAWQGDAAAIERQVTAAYELWFDTVRDPRFARILLVEILGVSPEMDALYEASARAMAALTPSTSTRTMRAKRGSRTVSNQSSYAAVVWRSTAAASPLQPSERIDSSVRRSAKPRVNVRYTSASKASSVGNDS